jgi:tetratricopeptide (TPR) repeat protein
MSSRAESSRAESSRAESFLAEVIRSAAGRIRAEYGIDAGLDPVADAVAGGTRPGAAVDEARRLLSHRRQSLERAQRAIGQLTVTVSHLARVLPFTAEGWPEQRDELRAQLARDPAGGVAAWLQYWFTAAAQRRPAALDRLLAEVPLPPGLDVLVDRAAAGAAALRARSWPSAVPMLDAGRTGLVLGGRRVPDRATSQALTLLTVRLALALDRADEAAALLDELTAAAEDDAAVSAWALQSRLVRQRGAEQDAAELLARAQELDPRNLDVTVELIRRARRAGELDTALEAAAAAVDALPSLADVDSDLDRLVDTPAELWLAAAERSARERDRTHAGELLSQAATVATADAELAAAIEESRATVVDEPAARRLALLAAGRHRVRCGHLEKAAADFAGAIGDPVGGEPVGGEPVGGEPPDPVRDEAVVRWADTVAALAPRRAIDDVAVEVGAALDAARAARERLGAVEWAWTYLSEASLLIQLSREMGAQQRPRRWAALLAAARGVALAPGRSIAWTTLSDAAQWLDLTRTALSASSRALTIDATSEEQGEHVRSLINLGDFPAVLDRLSATTDPWELCVRGYAQMCLGDRPAALGSFQGAAPMDPSWSFAWNGYLSALVQGGELGLAVEQATALTDALAGRPGEEFTAWAEAFQALLAGDWARAAARSGAFRAAAGPDSTDANLLVGLSAILGGDTGGWDAVRTSLRDDPGARSLGEWERITWPMVVALAAHHGVPVPDAAQVDPTLEEVRRIIAAGSTDLDELRAAARRDAAVPGATDAARLIEFALYGTALYGTALYGTALYGTAPPGPPDPEATARLAETAARFPAEIAALRDWHHREAEQARLRDGVREAWLEAHSLQTAAAASRLRPLIMADAVAVLNGLADLGGQTFDPQILAALGQLAGDAEVAAAVREVIGSVETEPEPEFAMRLPPSWFGANPGAEPQLRRHLDDVRLTADRPLPPIAWDTADECEPDGVAVTRDGTVVDRAVLDPDLRYVTDQARELLPAPERPVVATAFGAALHRRDLEEHPVHAELLTRGPLEVATAFAIAAIAPDSARPHPPR